MNSKPNSEKHNCQLGVYLRQRDKDYVVATRDKFRANNTNRSSLSIGDLLVALCIRYNKGNMDSESEAMLLDVVRTLESIVGELNELKEKCESILETVTEEGESDE